MPNPTDDLYLALAKAKLNGFFPDVSPNEVNYLREAARNLFTPDFNSDLAVYNLSATTRQKYKAIFAKADTGSISTICLMGHSYFAGSNATPGSTDFGSALKAELKLRNSNIWSGLVPFRNGEVRDNRYSNVSAGWGAANGAVLDFYGQTTTSGDTFTFTSDTVGTVVRIATFENSGPFSYSIDGAAAVTVATGTGAVVPRIVDVSGLSNTTHTVVITTTSTTKVYLIGVGVRSASGIEIANWGYGGSQASQWVDSVTKTQKRAVLQSVVPTRNIVFIEIDTNDLRLGVSVSSWISSMQTIISDEQTKGANVILINSLNAPGSGNLTPDQWQVYYKASYDLADQYDIPLFDSNYLLGGWSNVLANGLNGDTLHPNSAGFRIMAKAAADILLSK